MIDNEIHITKDVRNCAQLLSIWAQLRGFARNYAQLLGVYSARK